RRPVARLTQDGLSLGEGGQAALPQDARRPPPLPGGEDPRAGGHAPRGAHGLAPTSAALVAQQARTRRAGPQWRVLASAASSTARAPHSALSLRRSAPSGAGLRPATFH